MSIINEILPDVAVMRKNILDSGIEESVLDQEIAEMKKIKMFAEKEKLLYKILANKLGVELEVNVGSFVATEGEAQESGQYTLIKDLGNTEYGVVNIRGIYKGYYKDQKTSKGSNMLMATFMDESGELSLSVFEPKYYAFKDGYVERGQAYLLSNLSLRPYTDKDKKERVGSNINQNVSILPIKTGEFDLPSLADFKTDSIADLSDGEVTTFKGVVAYVGYEDKFYCPKGHYIKAENDGDSVTCSVCDTVVKAKQLQQMHVLVSDESAMDVIVQVDPSKQTGLKIGVGSGVYVRGRYKAQYNNVSVWDIIPYKLFETVVEEAPKPEEVSESAEPVSVETFDFLCDSGAVDPADELEELANMFPKIFRVFGLQSTPEKLQGQIEKRKHQKYKMQPIIQFMLDNKIVRIVDEPNTFELIE